jgi:rhodanese-related sulfurtransferase
MPSVPTVHPTDLATLMESGQELILVDVRTDEEYRALHAQRAIHASLHPFT